MHVEPAVPHNPDPLPLLHRARALEGCPRGADEDLLSLACPPLYTPFPNPFVGGFLTRDQLDGPPRPSTYHRKPIAADISEGRTDAAYLAQNYHTKVPFRAIARYIEHFTDPGDLVLDGFCGSGMVGVAANQTHRRAILCDLSPAATFTAHSLCHSANPLEAAAAFENLLQDLEQECGRLYIVLSPQSPVLRSQSSVLRYVIWSEVYRCPRCHAEFSFADAGFDLSFKRPRRIITCPDCDATLHPNELDRVLDENGRTRSVPVRVVYKGGGRIVESVPDQHFLALQREIEAAPIGNRYPDNLMMHREPSDDGWGDMWRRGYHSGMIRVPDFYFKRSLMVLATAVHLARESKASLPVRHLMLQTIVNASTACTRMHRAYQGTLPLVMYVPRLQREVNVIEALRSRFDQMLACIKELRASDDVLITTQSSTSLPNVPDGCVDYVFTDPPFGDNIRYSEVNFLWEAWLRAFTNAGPEAIISPGQRKGVAEYQELMRRCFAELHRILRPERWITVAFHNSEGKVWNAVQEALREAGFDVADVRLLDKRQVSFKQASAGTVRHDLVISARKTSPSGRRPLGGRNLQGEGVGPSPEQDLQSVWAFVERRLSELPIPTAAGGTNHIEERRGLELFNRMVADHLARGARVPLDVGQFLAGLRERFEERDGLYFLPRQALDYDLARR